MPATLDDVRRLVAAEHGLCVVAIARADMTVQASVVNAGVLEHPRSHAPVVGLVAAGNALKLRLLRTHPAATVVFRSGWEWVAVAGMAEIIGPDDPAAGVAVPGLLRDVFKAAGGTHDDWDEYDRVMAAERRAAVLIHPDRLTSNR